MLGLGEAFFKGRRLTGLQRHELARPERRHRRVVDLELIAITDFEVIDTVGRRCMNTPGTRLGGDVVAKHNGHSQCVVEGVLQSQIFQR